MEAYFTSTLTKEKFDELNKDDVIGKEQKKGKGLFNDGVKLKRFGYDKDNKANINIICETNTLKDCRANYNKFIKAFEDKFNEKLELNSYTEGFTKFAIKEK